jgi:hypothetical protein
VNSFGFLCCLLGDSRDFCVFETSFPSSIIHELESKLRNLTFVLSHCDFVLFFVSDNFREFATTEFSGYASVYLFRLRQFGLRQPSFQVMQLCIYSVSDSLACDSRVFRVLQNGFRSLYI